MELGLTGKKAVITAASRGIGLSIAQALAGRLREGRREVNVEHRDVERSR